MSTHVGATQSPSAQPDAPRFPVGKMGVGVWYGAGLLGVLEYVDRVMLPAWQVVHDHFDVGSSLQFGKTGIGLVLIALALAVVQKSFRFARPLAPASAEASASPRSAALAFPARITLAVGGFVLAFAALSVMGLLVALRTPIDAMLRGPLICMLSAAIGSSITTVMGYLKHASDQKDFDPAYSAWYIGRPVTGALLGLLFYFILRGGFIALGTNSSTQFDDFALAGAGGLVGLFSKNALEKLREIFDVIFRLEKPTGQTDEAVAPELKRK